MKAQVNSLKISSFPKILSLKSFGNWCVQFGDNPVFYFSAILWLRLQQKIKWVNINFEKRGLTSAQRIHLAPDDLYVQLRIYLIDGPFVNQKTYKDIQISYSLKHKHSKKWISLRKNKW